ncbi:MAG: hypothetical protein ABJF09_11005 [Qipengyuania citrea]|uniref:hypothetical protein n=1 Tax=Alphaproteobacteria TaxID=28211 RepID=UPI003266D697
MNPNTHTSDAEAEHTGAKEEGRKARFLNPRTLKRAFGILAFGLQIWRAAAKLGEWFS